MKLLHGMGRFFLVAAVIALSLILFQRDALASTRGSAPRLEATFASPEIAPGATWKVYFKGTDPDGDLAFIHAWLSIPGHSTTPVRFPVYRDQCNAVSGYLDLGTFEFGAGLKDIRLTGLRLWVSLEDQTGHRSEVATLKLDFYLGARPSSPPSGVFEEKFSGRIPGVFLTPGGGGR